MISKYRKKIDKIDRKIIKLLKQRLIITNRIGMIKKKNNLPICDKKREEYISQKLENNSKKYKINKRYLEDIFKIILKNLKDNQNKI